MIKQPAKLPEIDALGLLLQELEQPQLLVNVLLILVLQIKLPTELVQDS